MRHTYMQAVEKKAARAIGKDLPISTKVAIEIANFIRGKELERALRLLHGVQTKSTAVPYRRFTDGVGHRKGPMAAGRYPIKASGEFLALLENAKANAAAQGMSGTLIITHAAANRAARPMRNRAKYRGEFKRTHVEIIVIEGEPKQTPARKKAAAKAPAKKSAPKKEATPAKKAEPVKEAVAEQETSIAEEAQTATPEEATSPSQDEENSTSEPAKEAKE